MLTKTAPVTHVKAGPDDGLAEGQFEAFVSVFGNVDSYGDVVMPGAFTDTLAEWKASGNPIPVIWSHRYDDPDNHIGVALEAEERTIGGKSGLWILGQLDIDDDAKKARQVSRLLKGRRVTQFSFSYDILDAGMAKSAELGDYYELRKLRLFEVGPTLIGANQETELLGAKAQQFLTQFRGLVADAKAGRVLSAANEKAIDSAVDQILGGVDDLRAVLAQVQDSTTSDNGKATAGEPAKDEDPAGGKSAHTAAALAIALEMDLRINL